MKLNLCANCDQIIKWHPGLQLTKDSKSRGFWIAVATDYAVCDKAVTNNAHQPLGVAYPKRQTKG